ncbi:TPA: LOW QUALITY PROTEIN: hypothetical protein N0F65_000335, partial [Lagenidium giganteum]
SDAPLSDVEEVTEPDSDFDDEELSSEEDDISGEDTVSDEIIGDQRARIQNKTCSQDCLAGKDDLLIQFLRSILSLTKRERKVSLMATLTLLLQSDLTKSRRGKGITNRTVYVVPFVGTVCRDCFLRLYDMSLSTLSRMRRELEEGTFCPPVHGGRGNRNKVQIDVSGLVSWYQDVAMTVGEVAPVRVRRVQRRDGKIVRYTHTEQYTFLPAHLTWSTLHEQFKLYVTNERINTHLPSKDAFRKILTKKSPLIRIRTPRSNVCDTCSICKSTMTPQTTTDGCHGVVWDTHDASTAHATPSGWYFLSLISVNMFGVHCANDNYQYSYIYTERKGRKGANEFLSMVHRVLKVVIENIGTPRRRPWLQLWRADKNNCAIRFFVLLAQLGWFRHIPYKFMVKGHTKNSCDRGFGHVRKKLARSDCWTLADIANVVKEAASSSRALLLEDVDNVFLNFTEMAAELYRNLPAIKKYQLFSMDSARPGIVECRVLPDDEPVLMYKSRTTA